MADMTSKIVGVAVALMVVGIVFPVALNQLSGMGSDTLTTIDLYEAEVTDTGNDSFDHSLESDESFKEGTIILNYWIESDESEDVTVKYENGTDVISTPIDAKTLEDHGTIEKDITGDLLDNGTHKIVVSTASDNYDQLETSLQVDVEGESDYDTEFPSVTTILVVLLPVLAVVALVLKLTGRV